MTLPSRQGPSVPASYEGASSLKRFGGNGTLLCRRFPQKNGECCQSEVFRYGILQSLTRLGTELGTECPDVT
jgi:hypothetical protein